MWCSTRWRTGTGERRHHRRANPVAGDLRRPVEGHGRHVKQSGGHGQYAVCDIEVEPLPQGSGFEFVDRVVGGAVPRQFIPSVEKGMRAQMDKGVHAGYPVVDIRVTLVDGKAHSVDSSTWPSRWPAGWPCGRRPRPPGSTCSSRWIWSPCGCRTNSSVRCWATCPRAAYVLGTEQADESHTVINAEVPQVALTRYAIDLRSLTHGAATFTRMFARYEPMPESAAAKVQG